MQKAPIYQVQDKKKEELRYYSRLLLKKPGSVSSPFLCLSPVDDTCDSRAKLCKIGEECHEIIFPEYIRSSLDYQICPILSIPPLYFIVIFTVFTIFFLSFCVYLTFVFLLFYHVNINQNRISNPIFSRTSTQNLTGIFPQSFLCCWRAEVSESSWNFLQKLIPG